MPSSDPVQRFTDIVDNIDRIQQFTRGLDAATFAANDQVTFAVKYALMVISEATAKLGDIAPVYAPTFPGAKSVASAIGCGMIMTPLTWRAFGC